jgi:hypothetical protein
MLNGVELTLLAPVPTNIHTEFIRSSGAVRTFSADAHARVNCAAEVPAGLAACTVKTDVAGHEQLPLMMPVVESRPSPGTRAPLVMLHTTGLVLVTLSGCEYLLPTRAVGRAAGVTITGAGRPQR